MTFREEGAQACEQGLGLDANPYPKFNGNSAYNQWIDGWLSVRVAQARQEREIIAKFVAELVQ